MKKQIEISDGVLKFNYGYLVLYRKNYCVYGNKYLLIKELLMDKFDYDKDDEELKQHTTTLYNMLWGKKDNGLFKENGRIKSKENQNQVIELIESYIVAIKLM